MPGSVVLVGGDPGIGKSTLLLQMAGQLALAGLTVAYISAEESAGQLRLRASRLRALSAKLLAMAETNLVAIVEQLRQAAPAARCASRSVATATRWIPVRCSAAPDQRFRISGS